MQKSCDGHLLLGFDLSIMSIFGMVPLAGVGGQRHHLPYQTRQQTFAATLSKVISVPLLLLTYARQRINVETPTKFDRGFDVRTNGIIYDRSLLQFAPGTGQADQAGTEKKQGGGFRDRVYIANQFHIEPCPAAMVFG